MARDIDTIIMSIVIEDVPSIMCVHVEWLMFDFELSIDNYKSKWEYM